MLREVDGTCKGSLLAFLYGAGLIGALDPAVGSKNPMVALTGADYQGADLQGADLRGANLWKANLLRTRGLNQKQLERAIGDDKTTYRRAFTLQRCGVRPSTSRATQCTQTTSRTATVFGIGPRISDNPLLTKFREQATAPGGRHQPRSLRGLRSSRSLAPP